MVNEPDAGQSHSQSATDASPGDPPAATPEPPTPPPADAAVPAGESTEPAPPVPAPYSQPPPDTDGASTPETTASTDFSPYSPAPSTETASALETTSSSGGSGSSGGEGSETGDEAEEDGGGPIKTFLEHLEDLRWMLIKCAVALGVAMLICLIAGDQIMHILTWPLQRSTMAFLGKRQQVTVYFGTNRLGQFKLQTNQIGALNFGTERDVALRLTTVAVGTNYVMALEPVTDRSALGPGPLPVQLLNLSPAGGFFVAFQLAIYGGLVLAAPFLIYFIAQFVLPALKKLEKKYVLRGFAIGTGLFFAGVCFCYFILMPLALNASAKYSQWLGISADQWTAELYISFVSKFLLGMGLGFQLPVVILILVRIGILNHRLLSAGRRYMIVINLVLGAVLTTPEVLTQVMMFLPLQLLYEISVWIAWYWEHADRAKARRRIYLVLAGVVAFIALIGAVVKYWPQITQLFR